MKLETVLATLNLYPNKNPRLRLFALWYFTILICLWTIAGHTILGFEQSYAQPIVAVSTAIGVHALLEFVEARKLGRPPRFAGSWMNLLNFLPPAIIPGIACAMLTYANDLLWPVIFAAALSIASKVLLRAPLGGGVTQHIFNPSNFGITLTLLLFPQVGLAPPYQFTENLTGVWHWVLPLIILLTGLFVHGKFTGRLPLVLGWLTGFALQGIVRSAVFGIPLIVPFIPTTSAAFILFTLYMIPDPATTPIRKWQQVGYGVAIAAVYGMLLVYHMVFGLFIALFAMSAVRGLSLHLKALLSPDETASAIAAAMRPRPSVSMAGASGD